MLFAINGIAIKGLYTTDRSANTKDALLFEQQSVYLASDTENYSRKKCHFYIAIFQIVINQEHAVLLIYGI